MRITYYTNENTQKSLVTLEKDGEVRQSTPINEKEYEEFKNLHEKINSDPFHAKLFWEDMWDNET